MKKTLRRIVFFSSVLLLPGCAMYHYREGNRLYDHMAYHEAIPEYQRALSKKDIPDARLKLADCFRKTNNVDGALEEYGKAVQLADAQPEHYLHYARLLMRKQRYAEAKQWFDRYLEKVPGDSTARAWSLAAGDPESFKK